MRKKIILLSLLLCLAGPAAAQVGFGLRTSNVSIGINVPAYPQLVAVPDYPVYYAPDLNSNYFFYDGGYWVYQDDYWYTSSWYNGPWQLVDPEFVPLFVLRVPVRYYRLPPSYFRGWVSNAPPHWGEHWGNAWAQQRSGWDHWNRWSVPAAAPLPNYQKQYSGNRYPQAAQQQTVRSQHYNYQPHDALVRRQFQPEHMKNTPPARSTAQEARPTNKPHGDSVPQVASRSHPSPTQQSAHEQSPQPQPAAAPMHQQHQPSQPPGQPTQQREQTPPNSQHEEKGHPSRGNETQQKPKSEQEPNQERGHDRGDEHGQDRK